MSEPREVKLRYVPHARQVLAHTSPARYVLYGGGMAGGKSVFIANEAIQQCLDWPGNRVALFRWENRSFMSTTYVTLMQWMPMEVVKAHNLSNQTITFHNGSVLIYGGIKPSSSVSSGDPMARLKSLELGCALLDEVTEIPQPFFDILKTRIHRVWVTDPKTGIQVRPPPKLISTCNPESGYVKLLFIDQQLPDHAFIPSTVRDNPHAPPGYEDQLRKDLPADWVSRYVDGDWSLMSAVNALFPTGWLTRALKNSAKVGLPVDLGIDVATFGDDKTVIARRQGYAVDILYEAPPQSTMATANQIAEIMRSYRPTTVSIDAVGVGAGVCDRLMEMGLPITPIIGGASPMDKAHFVNLRAELHWGVRALLEKDLIRLPADPVLLNEMGGLRYLIMHDRKIQVESKETMRKRGMKSPNRSDAIVYCCGGMGLNYMIGGSVRV